MPRVIVHPLMFHWACERAGYGVEALVARYPKLESWLGGEAQPTLKQLESFANATHAPVGYFFLSQPPVERVPIPDCRTIGNALADTLAPLVVINGADMKAAQITYGFSLKKKL